jgi:tetratricopeptide (TPR) repeat protein
VGRPLPFPTDASKTVWNELQLLPKLEPGFGLPIAATEVDGKLWLISRDGGLAHLDSKKPTWTRFGAEQGLPASSFYSLQRLDDRRLLLAGKNENHAVAHFTFDVQSQEVVLLRRNNEPGQRQLRQLFPSGNDWNCWTAAGLWRSLLSEDAKFIPCSTPPLYGWREDPKALGLGYIRSSLDVAGRQFVTSDSGLYEVDKEANVVRSWFAEKPLIEQFPLSALSGRVLVLPGNSPIRDEHAVRCGKTIVFAKGGLLIYAPESDTWYGPVEDLKAAHIYASGANLWLTTSNGLLHVDPRDVVAAAEKAGRVYTTAEFHERQAAARAVLPLAEQGKLLYAQREFEQAIKCFEQALKANAHDGEAAGLVGDALVQLKRLDDAVAAYDRLAQQPNPQWSVEGFYRAAIVLHHQKNWDELRKRLDQIDTQFPQLADYRRTALNKFRAALEKEGKS